MKNYENKDHLRKTEMIPYQDATVTTQDVEKRMIVLRKQPVLIDADVAELYGVQTKQVNQAIKNNPGKFPLGYVFELDRFEKEEVVKKIDHLKKLKFSKVQPTAFTERGLYMLATILKGERAVNTTLAIVDTFVQVRELARTMEALQRGRRRSATAEFTPTYWRFVGRDGRS